MAARTACLPALAVLLAAACGSGPGGEWGGTVTDSAGVAIVANPVQGVWKDAQAWRVEEEMRIGTADGDAAYQFGAVVGIDVDGEGRIYVLDQQAQNVRVYDRAGAHLRTIGRPGSGPGELSRGAMAVLVGRGDTIFVPDAALQRVSRFLPDGAEAGSFAVPMADGIPMRWAESPAGDLLVQLRTMPLTEQLATREQRNVVLVRGPDGAVRDTLLHLPLGGTIRFQGGATRFRFFEPEALWEVGPDGSAYAAVNSEYRIEVRDAGGRLTRVVTRPFERLSVSEADRTAFLEAFRELFRRQGVPQAQAEQILRNVEFADRYPAFARLAAGPEATLWVQRVRSAEQVAASGAGFDFEDIGAPEWDVFDAEGRYLGVVAFPARFNPLRFDGDEVYGVWKDGMDVPHVMRVRITRPAGV